jgi:hypothetical protein
MKLEDVYTKEFIEKELKCKRKFWGKIVTTIENDEIIVVKKEETFKDLN